MRALLLVSVFVLTGCSVLSHPIRASSLGAPTTVSKGEQEFIGGAGLKGASEPIVGDDRMRIATMGLLGGTWRGGLTDRVALDVGGELLLSEAWRPATIAASTAVRYTTDPRPLQTRAIWADFEVGVGANLMVYDIKELLPGVGAYAGAGVAARFGKVTTFARYRFQVSEGRDQATADYHAAYVGVQGPVSKRVDLYAATGLATAGGRTDLDREIYDVYGPFPLHIDLGVRVSLPERGASGRRPARRPPSAAR